jgi:hypothetical protein
MIIEWCNINQGFLMALLTAVYAIATIFLVRIANKSNSISEKNVRDLTRLEQERMRPLVDVRIESDIPFLILRISNHGLTPAYAVSMKTIPIIKAVMGGDDCHPSTKTEKAIGIIEHGIGSLGAGCSESVLLGTFTRIEEVYPELIFKGTITFESFNRTRYSSPVSIDLRYKKGALHVNHKTIDDVANQLEEMCREIRHIGSGFHKPHIITQSKSEKLAEDEKNLNKAREQLEQIASHRDV